MKKIAITGNIGSGKTVAEKYYKSLGFKTLCLDEATSEIYKNAAFKKEIFEKFGTFNKKELSAIVFKNSEKLKTLEKIIYPYLKSILFDFFKNNQGEKVLFVAAPVLFEAGFDVYFDKTIFISSFENLRLKRAIERDKAKKDEIEAKIKAQQPEEEKIKKSQYIIKNNGTKEELIQNSKKVLDKILKDC